jgi:hypothetical protein
LSCLARRIHFRPATLARTNQPCTNESCTNQSGPRIEQWNQIVQQRRHFARIKQNRLNEQRRRRTGSQSRVGLD